MSTRRDRARNAIRGPQSALTDFLAANNISALQIRQDHDRRRAEAERAAAEERAQNGEDEDSAMNGVEEDVEDEEEPAESSATAAKKKKKQDAAIRKIKEGKKFKQMKRQMQGEPGEDDDDEIALDIYAKSVPVPGQLENCEECGKRFTVTPYSKEGSMGGLLCTKCSKSRDAEQKKIAQNKKSRQQREKRRKIQSEILDGANPQGAKTLQELCVNVVARNINEVDEFGDLPPKLRDRLSQVMSKGRILSSNNVQLLTGSDVEHVAIYDCGKLEPHDFVKILAFSPQLKRLTLENAGQMKDETIDYLIEKNHVIEVLKLEAPNLISNEKWCELFEHLGANLRELKLTWLDDSMDDATISQLVDNCPNLTYLKLKRCFKMTNQSLAHLAKLKSLQHLYLRTPVTDADALVALIASVGPNLRTLSLDALEAADDRLLEAIHENCHHLTKLRLTSNDEFTDRTLAGLFRDWKNPPLVSVNFTSVRSSNPHGEGDDDEEEGGERPLHIGERPLHVPGARNNSEFANGESMDGPVHGFGPLAFTELVRHSATRLERINLASCRHIGHGALFDAFAGTGASDRQWSNLKFMDLSFVEGVDSTILSGIFKSARAFERLVVFGCFSLRGMEKPPPGVAVIGVPNSQDTIWMEG